MTWLEIVCDIGKPMSKLPSFTIICSPLVAALIGLFACEAEPEPQTFDPDAVIAEAVDFKSNFERIDLDGLVTMHDANGLTTSRIWANEIGAEVFRTIDLTDPNQMVEMPRGAVFLKESDNAQGEALDAMQLLAKFEEGYHPLGGDWFFAMIQRDGTPIDERIGNGAKVTFCVDCHDSMGPNTDFVIGLPADQLAP